MQALSNCAKRWDFSTWLSSLFYSPLPSVSLYQCMYYTLRLLAMAFFAKHFLGIASDFFLFFCFFWDNKNHLLPITGFSVRYMYECVGVRNVDAYWTAQCIWGICSGQMCCMLQGQKDFKWRTKTNKHVRRQYCQVNFILESKLGTYGHITFYKQRKSTGTALCVPQPKVCIQTSLAVTRVHKHLDWCPSGTNILTGITYSLATQSNYYWSCI